MGRNKIDESLKEAGFACSCSIDWFGENWKIKMIYLPIEFCVWRMIRLENVKYGWQCHGRYKHKVYDIEHHYTFRHFERFTAHSLGRWLRFHNYWRSCYHRVPYIHVIPIQRKAKINLWQRSSIDTRNINQWKSTPLWSWGNVIQRCILMTCWHNAEPTLLLLETSALTGDRKIASMKKIIFIVINKWNTVKMISDCLW